jgi:hypothetical protein
MCGTVARFLPPSRKTFGVRMSSIVCPGVEKVTGQTIRVAESAPLCVPLRHAIMMAFP